MSEGSRPPEGSSSASCSWGSSSEVLAPPLLVSRHQRAGESAAHARSEVATLVAHNAQLSVGREERPLSRR